MTIRQATHAGSWYSAFRAELDRQLSGWLAQSGTKPGPNTKAIIAPHAGYSYSGPPAAWAYSAIDPAQYDRVFILGPSHHFYLDGCALSQCDDYATPIGSLPLDKATIAELHKTGKFDKMSLQTDEDEHSIEMHLPYVRKVFEGRDIKIVPILVGSISTSAEASYGKLLAPYLASPRTLFVISSDFCHWGTRFRYTYYNHPSTGPTSLDRTTSPAPDHPVHKSIDELDHRGMDAIQFGQGKTAGEAHDAFAGYLKETRNTICGRHPIGVLLGAVKELEKNAGVGGGMELEWVRYEQSSACLTVKDSSVSYASGVVRK